MIERLELKNFAAFNSLSIDFSPRINVIVGENSTGKTHLLKAAYGLCAGAQLFKKKPDTSDDELQTALTTKLLRLFMPLDDKLGKMHHQGATEQASLSARFSQNQKIAVTYFKNSKTLAIGMVKWLSAPMLMAMRIPIVGLLAKLIGSGRKLR